jgi:aspartate kinase
MSLVVMKFGGSSVADSEKLKNVASRIIAEYKKGTKVIVVVSAQGKTTDEFIAKAEEVNANPSRREMDVLLSAGEQISMALLAMTIEAEGVPVVSLTGWQAEIFTDSNYSNARVDKIVGERIRAELDKNNIVIVAGFQGINKNDNITTMGRGGSDTTAVALAAALRADLCEIYTDVDGVFTTDPRIVKGAYKLNDVSYDEMLELASLGANVLHNRSVEMAMKYNVPLMVKSSIKDVPGTIIKEVNKVEKMLVRGVTRDNDVAKVTLYGLDGDSKKIFGVFELLARDKVSVDIILLSDGRDGKKDLTFTVSQSSLPNALKVIEDNSDFIDAERVESETGVAKVSIVGAGMANNPGVAAAAFDAMADNGVEIKLVTTSEIKVSMLVDEKDADRGVNALHEKFLG